MVEPVEIRRPLGDNAPTATLLYGADCRETLQELDTGSVHTVVTSPPYWGLRDYGAGDETQIGQEETPEKYVEHLVEIFRGVRRVLRDDGTLWLNLGDSYNEQLSSHHPALGFGRKEGHTRADTDDGGLKENDLVGVPWMVAFALRTDGWYLRSDIIWAKSVCMPESVVDRPMKAHEYLFLFSKQPHYFYDADAVREPLPSEGFAKGHDGRIPATLLDPMRRNKRSWWNVNPRPYPGAHFAVFPPELITPCVLAGTSQRGCCPLCGTPWGRSDAGSWETDCGCPEHEPVPCTVLDPFSGTGTAGLVALDHGRDFIGLDINAGYVELAKARFLDEGLPLQRGDEDKGGILNLLGVEGL